MKNTILAILMVALVATPCLAQQIEPDGLFSIDGTRWVYLPFTISISPIPWLFFHDSDSEYGIGFSDGEVYPYPSSLPASNSFYLELGIVSIFMYEQLTGLRGWGSGDPAFGFGVLQPIGVGMVITNYPSQFPPIRLVGINLLIKAEDDWTPPEEE